MFHRVLKTIKKPLFAPPAIAAILIIFYIIRASETRINDQTPADNGPISIGRFFAEKYDSVVKDTVIQGQTFASIASSTGISYVKVVSLLDGAKKIYGLDKIVAGHELSFIFDKAGVNLRKVIYQIDNNNVLIIKQAAANTWNAERLPIPYEVKTEEISGSIDSSLFQSITASGGDERLALALAEVFAWQIDFAADIRKGDTFKVIYEKRSLGGNYIMPGNILAAKFVNEGNVFNGVHFSSDGKEGYYDENGVSLEKIFLKSPLSYKYISSGFSYNRLNPVTKTFHTHRAIDYAAAYGTPAVSVGDGIVVSAGWNGDLGKAVFVRHNDTYTTVYGHLSRIAVNKGTKIKQGQVIGYVGATGQATGPHLHFELHKNGAFVNPLTIELPPGEPIPNKDKIAFSETIAKYKNFFAN